MKIRVTYDKAHNCKRFLNDLQDLPLKFLMIMKKPLPGYKNGTNT
jgi:hypothetical protein